MAEVRRDKSLHAFAFKESSEPFAAQDRATLGEWLLLYVFVSSLLHGTSSNFKHFLEKYSEAIMQPF